MNEDYEFMKGLIGVEEGNAALLSPDCDARYVLLRNTGRVPSNASGLFYILPDKPVQYHQMGAFYWGVQVACNKWAYLAKDFLSNLTNEDTAWILPDAYRDCLLVTAQQWLMNFKMTAYDSVIGPYVEDRLKKHIRSFVHTQNPLHTQLMRDTREILLDTSDTDTPTRMFKIQSRCERVFGIRRFVESLYFLVELPVTMEDEDARICV